MINWNSLKVIRTLNVDWHTKYIALLVTVSSEDHPTPITSVLLAQRQGFDSAEDVLAMLHKKTVMPISLELLTHNDIYYQYLVNDGHSLYAKLQAIHPATEAHIAKYTKQERHFVTEDAQTYQDIVKPYIASQSTARVKWIDNIFEGISEKHLIIVEKEQYIILPDSKWDQKTLSSLYLLALFKSKELRSLRDLAGKHLPLLKELAHTIRTGLGTVHKDLHADQLRVYVHYPPTYYYFHVHIVHIDYETSGCSVGAAVLLDDVIDNLQLDPDYYQKRRLSYVLWEGHELYKLLAPKSE